jgi:AcrR family transcriptional regulator
MKTRARKGAVQLDADGDRESQILEAATRIFQERGYDATTIQAIADDVGILKGSLYYYIEKKEDLLFQIVEGVHRGLARSLEHVDAEKDPLERIRVFIAAHVRFIAENLSATRVFLHDFRALSPGRRKEIVSERDEYEGRLRELLGEAQQAGVVRDDLDLDLAVLAIFGMMNWMYQWYRLGGRNEPEEIGWTFAEFALSGLRADAQR